MKYENFISIKWIHYPFIFFFSFFILSNANNIVCWWNPNKIEMKYAGSLWWKVIERNRFYVQSSRNRWPVMFTVSSKRERFIFRSYTTFFDVTGKVFLFLIDCFFFNEQCLLFDFCSKWLLYRWVFDIFSNVLFVTINDIFVHFTVLFT